MAELLFTSFAFNATDGTTPRTEPDRWSDWHNVLDFGADPTFATDSTAAIQAAIDWTISDQRGTVYFPPGTYKVIAPLELYFGTGANQSICLRGDGMASRIQGSNCNGYIFDRYDPTWETPSGIIVIEKLMIHNNLDDAGTGAIRLGNCNGAVVRDCFLSGFTGIDFTQNDMYGGDPDPLGEPQYLSTNCEMSNCLFSVPGDARQTGTTGVVTGNSTSIIGFDGSAMDCAIRLIGSGSHILGGRMEVNNYTVIFGVDHLGNTVPAIGCTAGGFTTESFYQTDFDMVNADGCTLFSTGGSTFVGGNYGLRLRSGVSNCTIMDFNMSGGYGSYAISIEDSTGSPGRGNTFIGVSSQVGGDFDDVKCWNMPTKARTAQFINSTNFAPTFLFANLPSDPVVGEEFLISNSNIAASAANFAATIAGGGANTVRGRWNGSNWVLV